jgi:hypothetical protein
MLALFRVRLLLWPPPWATGGRGGRLTIFIPISIKIALKPLCYVNARILGKWLNPELDLLPA